MKPGFESFYRAQVEGKEIKKECAVGLGGERNHLSPRLAHRLLKDPAKVGRLAAQPCAVINNLAVYFPSSKVDETHAVWFPSSRPPPRPPGDWRLSIADCRLLVDIGRSCRTTFSIVNRQSAIGNYSPVSGIVDSRLSIAGFPAGVG
jgi:hypothetical protein